MTGDARNGDCKVEVSGPCRSIWLRVAIIMSSEARPASEDRFGRLDDTEGLTRYGDGARVNA